jgi:prolyl oligopeptidase
MRTDLVTLPMARGDRYFFKRRRADQDLYVIYLRQGRDGTDEVLLDPHPASPDHTVSFDLTDVSRDGRLLAYSVRKGGEDEVEIRLFDVERRCDLPDRLPRDLYFGVALTPERTGLFYTRQTEAGPRIFHHAMGTEAAADREVFGAGYGPEKLLFGSLSEDGRYLLVQVLWGSSADKTELYLRDLAEGGGFVPVVNDLDARFLGEVAGGTLFLHTNWQAPQGRVLAVDPRSPARENWREVVPQRPDSVIEGISAVAGRLFVNYLKDVQSRLVAFAPDGRELGEIAFDTLGTVSGVGGLWEGEEAFFAFSSFHVPATIYRYEVGSGRREVWAEVEVPIDPRRFAVEQVWLASKDGTRVPMFLVHGKDLRRDGSNPTLLTGYGGFLVSQTPVFSAPAAAWVELGGVYAVANLRGGGEFGEEWHRAGMRQAKQNTFDDFIAAAEWLIGEGYTRPGKLAVSGGSNGGLLVGALLTQRPELAAAVVCNYPLLDMLRYHRFLMGPYWVPEYGSPDDPEEFRWLAAYSPYHHVRRGVDYPAVLFITGDGDTRVAPLHARKMAARLQAVAKPGTPILLRYHTKAGHSGGQPLSEQIDKLTEAYSFLRWRLGEG